MLKSYPDARSTKIGPIQIPAKSALFELRNPLNVLVLGPHDSGKTTVINSLLMAVRKVWCDRAPYGHGSKHQFSPILLYENPNHHPRQPYHDRK